MAVTAATCAGGAETNGLTFAWVAEAKMMQCVECMPCLKPKTSMIKGMSCINTSQLYLVSRTIVFSIAHAYHQIGVYIHTHTCYVVSTTVTSDASALRIPHSTRLSALGTRLSALGTRLSALGTRPSALGTRLSALGTRLSALGTRLSARNLRHSTLSFGIV